jgi:hypothetical protein
MVGCNGKGATRITGSACPVTMLCLLLAQSAVADDLASPPLTNASGLQLDPPSSLSLSLDMPDDSASALSAAILPDGAFDALAESGSHASAHELAGNLNVQIDQKRRKFRNRTVNFVAERSVFAGTMTDLLLDGSDTGWHLAVDATGTREYVVEWKTRFR